MRASCNVRRPLIGLLVALCAALVGPATARAATSAELQAQVDEAKARRDSLREEAALIAGQLNETRARIDETTAQVEEKQQDIDAKGEFIRETEAEVDDHQGRLADQVALSYKQGTTSFLDIFLNSSSFEELLSRIYYAGKVMEQQEATIRETQELQAQLEEEKAELDQAQAELREALASQEELARTQSEQQAEADAKAQEAEDYVNGLSEELRTALAQEEEARRRQEEAEAARRASQNRQPAPAQSQSSGGTTGSGGNSSSGGSSSSSSSGGTYPGGGGLTQAQRNAIMDVAWGYVGKIPYVLYGESLDGIDCSGFTQRVYREAIGFDMPHRWLIQRQMSTVKPLDDCLPGDLVFWDGHVAIYAGKEDGTHMCIEAVPGYSIRYAPVWGSIYGGGNPLS